MTKNDFLMRLNKNLKFLDSSTRDDLLEYYEEIIDEEINEGKSINAILNKLGNPDELARNIMENMKNGESSTEDIGDILIDDNPTSKNKNITSEKANEKTQTSNVKIDSKMKDNGVAHTQEKNKKFSMFWIIYFCLGFITIPLTFALSVVGLVFTIMAAVVAIILSLSGFIIVLSGILIIVIGIIYGVMGHSVMVALAFGSVGLITFALGLYFSYLTIKLFKKIIIRKKGAK